MAGKWSTSAQAPYTTQPVVHEVETEKPDYPLSASRMVKIADSTKVKVRGGGISDLGKEKIEFKNGEYPKELKPTYETSYGSDTIRVAQLPIKEGKKPKPGIDDGVHESGVWKEIAQQDDPDFRTRSVAADSFAEKKELKQKVVDEADVDEAVRAYLARTGGSKGEAVPLRRDGNPMRSVFITEKRPSAFSQTFDTHGITENKYDGKNAVTQAQMRRLLHADPMLMLEAHPDGPDRFQSVYQATVGPTSKVSRAAQEIEADNAQPKPQESAYVRYARPPAGYDLTMYSF